MSNKQPVNLAMINLPETANLSSDDDNQCIISCFPFFANILKFSSRIESFSVSISQSLSFKGPRKVRNRNMACTRTDKGSKQNKG